MEERARLLRKLNEEALPFLLVKPPLLGSRDTNISVSNIRRCIQIFEKEGCYVKETPWKHEKGDRVHFIGGIEVYKKLARFHIEFLDLAGVWNRSVEQTENNIKFRVPCKEDQLLILCSHSLWHMEITEEEAMQFFEIIGDIKIVCQTIT